MLTGHEMLALLVAAVVVRHVVLLWRHPYGPCLLCGGSRKNKGSTAKAYGRCLLCKGSGERRRFGARMVHRALRRRL